MRLKKFAAIILMSTKIGTMSLSGCGGVNKDAVAITMTSDDKDAIEVTMGYANFAANFLNLMVSSIYNGHQIPRMFPPKICTACDIMSLNTIYN